MQQLLYKAAEVTLVVRGSVPVADGAAPVAGGAILVAEEAVPPVPVEAVLAPCRAARTLWNYLSM